MKSLQWMSWLIAVLLVGAGAWFGRTVPFTVQWPLYEALRATAAIIFAVIGAWLAIIYPERLRMSFKTPPDEKTKGNDASSTLFTPIVNSTFILCIILAIGVIAPLLRSHVDAQDYQLYEGFKLSNIAFGRGLSYGLLVALTLWQLWTVFCTLDPADRIKSFMDRESRHKRNVDAVRAPRPKQ